MKNYESLMQKPSESFYAFRKGLQSMAREYKKINLLMAAVRLDVFNKLKIPMGSEEASGNIGILPDLAEFFLDALVQEGYLTRNQDGEYHDSDLALMHLVDGAEDCLANRIKQDMLWLEPWNDMGRILREGPLVLPYEVMYGPTWVAAIGETRRAEGLSEFIGKIESLIPMDDVKTMMEIGPGHAFHLISLCCRHRHIKADFYDKPEICEYTRSNGRDFGVELCYQAGDYYEKPVTGSYDFVLISFNPAGSDVTLAHMVASCVSEGGYLMIRRHGNRKPAPDAMADLEVNLRRWVGQEEVRRAGWGDTRNGNEGYDDAIISERFELIHSEPYDVVSELRVFRRVRN